MYSEIMQLYMKYLDHQNTEDELLLEDKPLSLNIHFS